jgi:hypothetical protein
MRRQRVNELAPPVGGRSPARKAHECARKKTIVFCILREECDESVALAPFLLAPVREMACGALWSGYEPTHKRSRP